MTKILIADDEKNILMLTGHMFRELGMDVVCASSGEEAVLLAIKEKPDLIITDVKMPNTPVDGFEVCRRVRNDPEISDIPIIILSAMGDEYNKLTGFNEGADDYVTKPFNSEELKARVKALLLRYHSRKINANENVHRESSVEDESQGINKDIETISTGIEDLDANLFGGLPKGSNILITGEIGLGKSTFSRQFIAEGLRNSDRCMMVALDDAPNQIRKQLNKEIIKPAREYERLGLLRFVDAYSWSSLTQPEDEPFAINGILELNQLSGVISDASFELGQSVQNKMGGRRVIDSISSLLINFELPSVQRFINSIARTALAFGGVTTLFIIESGTVSDQVMNNIKYIMDGVIEFGEYNRKKAVRVASMKWTPYSKKWTEIGDLPSDN